MMRRLLFKHIGIGALFFGILFIAFWIRVQGGERLYMKVGDEKVEQFTENDAYLYHWQAKEINKRGILPFRDKHRWLPLGRDNRQLLSLYAYAIAYTHKVFPWFSLYHIQLYAPILCFTIGLGVLFIFLARTYGVIFASIVGLLLATLPGSIERSAIGFGDRDAWCWMLGVLAVTSYLWKEQMDTGPRRWIVAAVAGFTVFLGGLSWEGFGFFVLIILCAELWKFCTTDTEHRLKEYVIWMLMFVPLLYMLSPAYRSGYGFSTHVTALMLLPAITVFLLRGTRYLLIRYIESLHGHAKKLAVGLTFLGIVAGGCYIIFQFDTFETTTFSLQESRLMQNVGELVDPDFRYWHRRYGGIFILGSIGLLTTCFYFWQRNGIPLAFSLTLFSVTVFFREPVSGWISGGLCDTLFFISLILTFLWFGIVSLRKTPDKNELVAIAIFAWFLLWVALARGGKRYDFFIGLPLAYGTAWLLWFAPTYLIQKLKDAKVLYPNIKAIHITIIVVIVVLIPVSFWTPLGGHATRSVYAAAEMRKPVPGKGPVTHALTWIKNRIPQNAVFAANWPYGTQLNVFGGVKTITDPDHFLPHWIHLYYRHVFCAENEKEALEFLNTYNATHLMLTRRNLTGRAHAYSLIGSNTKNDRHFRFYQLTHRETYIGAPYQIRPKEQGTPLEFVDIVSKTSIRNPGEHTTVSNIQQTINVTVHFKTHHNIVRNITIMTNRPTQHVIDIEDGGIVFYFGSKGQLHNAYYVPPLGWNSLAVKLFLRRQHSNVFVPVYSTQEVKIWEIRYPLGIRKDSKYLRTEPETSHEE